MDKLFIRGTRNEADCFIQQLDVKTGKVQNEQTVHAPWLFSQETSCIIIAGQVVCIDQPSSTIHCLKLEPDRISLESISLSMLLPGNMDITDLKLSVLHSPSVKHQHKEFVLHLSRTHSALLRVNQDQSVAVIKEFLAETLFFASVVANSNSILMTATLKASTTQLNCYNLDTMKEIEDIRYTVNTFPEHHGQLEQIYTHFFFRKDNTIGYRVLALFQDHSLSLIQHTGRLIWTREESLASITAVEMVELPVSPKQANFEALQKEFGYHHDGRHYKTSWKGWDRPDHMDFSRRMIRK